jgi:tellurite resistance protein TerC
MLVIANQIIRYPWLQLVGGAYLVYLGIEHLADIDEHDGGAGTSVSPQVIPSFWHVVLTVELMDLVFSLDNVVAAVALSDHLWVVLLGVALGILTLRWAAGIFSIMVDREPILRHAAYMLVLVIGLEFCLEQLFELHIPTAVQFFISLAILGSSLLYAHWAPLRVFHPIVHAIRRLLHKAMTAIKSLLAFRSGVRVETESGEERG